MGRSKDLADLGSSATRLDTIGASSGALSNKNVVINGAMNVAQRATSATGVGASTGYFTCDRWKYYTSATAGRVTLTQDSSGPSGFANSFKIATTTADTSIAASEQVMIQQRIEGQNLQHFKKGTSDALPWTLSFYVKGNASATYVAELMDSDNSDRHVNKQFTVGTDWSRVVIEFPADTTGVLDDDSNVSIDLQIILHSGSTFTSGTLQETWGALNQANRAVGISSILDSTDRTFFITGVQLEAGSVTDFEHEPVGVTLNKCRRYYNQVLKGAWGVASAAGSPSPCWWEAPQALSLSPLPTSSSARGRSSARSHIDPAATRAQSRDDERGCDGSKGGEAGQQFRSPAPGIIRIGFSFRKRRGEKRAGWLTWRSFRICFASCLLTLFSNLS